MVGDKLGISRAMCSGQEVADAAAAGYEVAAWAGAAGVAGAVCAGAEPS